jgi:hypothetical protein
MRILVSYLLALSTGRMILWCYLIWYLTVLISHFDPTPSLWLNSLGISVIIGIALRLSIAGHGKSSPDGWQVFRLFLMPFCVSSFAALIKGHGFILIIPPEPGEAALAIGGCAAFVLGVLALKRWNPAPQTAPA